MDWRYGYSAIYYATYVDPVSWRDIERLEIIEGSINRENSSLMESADIKCRIYDTSQERWMRIYLEAKQNGSGERVALFTGLATSPGVDINGTIKEYPLQLYSVLKPAEDILLERGWYAPTGIAGSRLVKQLLSVCPCPIIEKDRSPSLSQNIIAEDGETNLTMAEKILAAIGWRLRISGDGTVTICPKARDISQTFSVLINDSIEPKMELKQDWFSCPNVFRAVNDTESGVARDDNPKSPLSTVTRGREVWAEETSCDFNVGETIGEYASRRLKEEQSYYMTVSYDRRYDPDVLIGDQIRLHYPEQGIDGIFRVTSQSIELGYGARTSEEVVYGDQ